MKSSFSLLAFSTFVLKLLLASARPANSDFPTSSSTFNATDLNPGHSEDLRDLLSASSEGLAQIIESCTKPNVIALTFDDGPYKWHGQVSKTLLKYGAKGTFFINGNNYDCVYSENVANQLIQSFEDGHQIGSHTWSHPHMTRLSSSQQKKELTKVDTAMRKILGVKAAFMRPPFGEYNNAVRRTVASNGQKMVLWDFDSGDSTGSSASQSERAYDKVLSKHPKNLLALNHETEISTVKELLPYVLRKYIDSGYTFVTVAECLGMEPYLSTGNPSTRDSSWRC